MWWKPRLVPDRRQAERSEVPVQLVLYTGPVADCKPDLESVEKSGLTNSCELLHWVKEQPEQSPSHRLHNGELDPWWATIASIGDRSRKNYLQKPIQIALNQG